MVKDEIVIKYMVLNKMVINGTVVYNWSLINRFMLWYIYEVLKYIFFSYHFSTKFFLALGKEI